VRFLNCLIFLFFLFSFFFLFIYIKCVCIYIAEVGASKPKVKKAYIYSILSGPFGVVLEVPNVLFLSLKKWIDF
jgi:hypothetical protein